MGIKSLELINETLIMKLLWGIYHNPSDLWVQVLHGKYGRGLARWEKLEAKPSDSLLWKEIVRIWEKFQVNIQREIRNRRNTSVWYDKWIDNAPPLSEFIPSQVEIDKNLMVNELINSSGGWDLQALPECIPTYIREAIKCMVPPNREEKEDSVKWLLNANGKFTTASAYSMLHNDGSNDHISTLWKNIWKLKLPERVKVFMWQANHDRLLTNDLISKWGTGERGCHICHEDRENIIHALRECSHARRTWEQLVPRDMHGTFFNLNFGQWMQWNILSRTKEDNYRWPEIFTVGCWFIWKWRNLQVHEPTRYIPCNTGQIIKRYLEHFNQKWDYNGRQEAGQQVIEVYWKPPPQGWCKLNVDGMSNSMGASGCGGVVRGDCGEWLCGFSRKLNGCNSKTAEAWGLLEGLQMCWDLGFKKIEVECDAEEVVKELNDEQHIAGCYLVSRQISQFLKREWQVRISHVY